MSTMGKIGSYIGGGVHSVSANLKIHLQPDGSLKSSPWYVRFGNIQGVLKARENVVKVSVNGVEAGFCMNLDSRGQAYFLRERDMEDGYSLTTLTSEQLAALNLKEGKNVIEFTCSRQQVDACTYLWRWDANIVISDVDGTITRSDVLGQFMSLVGRDWSQTGVAHLLSAIKYTGYLTRQLLFNLMQDGKGLSEGPVFTSPDGLFLSLYREVVKRAPQEFKIACLQEIKALFPSDRNPFYAGFGNRDTDELCYLKVEIPQGKIFTINSKVQIVLNRHIDTKSYACLHGRVNDMFPPTSSLTRLTI
ncbi:unnamed protein product [Withania somnifera]